MELKKGLRYALWTVTTVLFLLLSTGLLLSFVFDEQVKEVVIRELNKNLAVPVRVDQGDIRFSVFRDFPDASLSFGKLSIAESLKDSEEDFLSIDRLALRFSMRDVVRGRYVIRRIALENGQVNLRRLPDGQVNYKFWKQDPDAGSQEVELKLEQVLMRNVRIRYHKEASRGTGPTLIDLEVKKGSLSGELLDDDYEVQLDLLALVHALPSGQRNLFAGRELQLRGGLKGQISERLLELNQVTVQLGSSRLLISGPFQGGPDSHCELNIKAENWSAATAMELAESLGWKLPAAQNKKGGTWKGKGRLALEGSLSGALGKGKRPLLSLSFSLQDGALSHPAYGLQLDHLRFKGSYDGQKGGRLVLDQLEMRQAGEMLKADFHLSNFRDPSIDLQASGRIALPFLSLVLPQQFSQPRGSVEIQNVHIKGRIRDLKENPAAKAIATGQLSLEGVSVVWRAEEWSIPSGRINLDADRLIFEELQMEGAGSAVLVNGQLRNGLANLFASGGGTPLPRLEGQVNAPVFDLSRLLQVLAQREENIALAAQWEDVNAVRKRSMKLPRLAGELEASVGEFRYGDVRFNELRSKWRFTPGYWRTENIKGQAMSGVLQLQVSLRQTPEQGLLLDAQGQLHQIQIEECFRQFRDFGQSELTHRHLQGRLSGTLHHVQLEWDRRGQFLQNELLLHSDVEVRDGALLNYAPVEALSRFINIEELKHIRFSTLNNSIRIINKKINIPLMDIESSALNLSLTGTHDFSGYVDYQVKVSLFEILGKKFARTQNQNMPFTEGEKSGGLSVYVSMKGMPDQLQMEYNRRESRQTFKQNESARERRPLFKPGRTDKSPGKEKPGDLPELMDWDENENQP